tara:strand:+ start:285 stop:809 length:525 start_codon:yes stop_codon:yes gene_type:complete
MPCTKCDNDKYKWGDTGECKYATKEECEKANPKNYTEMKGKPTPFGKTYEEYEKELKEFNLSKVEKVELGIIDDLTEGFNWLVKQNATIEKQLKPIYSNFSSLRQKVNDVKGYSMVAMRGVKQGETNVNRIEKQLKELGINVNSVPVIKKFKSAVSQAKENSKIVKGIPDIPKL